MGEGAPELRVLHTAIGEYLAKRLCGPSCLRAPTRRRHSPVVYSVLRVLDRENTSVLGKVAVEIVYPTFGALIDRRGLVVDSLMPALGPGFHFSLGPQDLEFADETTRIRCDLQGVRLTQERPQTPVLAEEYASQVWRALVGAGLPREILRLGTRFFVWWRMEDEAAAISAMRRSGLVEVPSGWASVFGEPNGPTVITARYTADGMSVRVSLDTARNVFVGQRLWLDESRMQAEFPQHVIQLDADLSVRGISARPEEIPRLIRKHWQVVTPWLETLGGLFDEG